jgi:multidrug efflux pump subunit AcrA (membrane-fusion protein)
MDDRGATAVYPSPFTNMTKLNSTSKRTPIYTAVLLLVSGGLLTLASSMLPSALEDEPPSVDSPTATTSLTAVTASRIEFTNGYELARTFTGELRPARDAKLGFQVGGLVQEVLVHEGDRVAAGEALARIDQRRLVIARSELMAKIGSASASLDLLRAGPREQTISVARARVVSANEQLSVAKNRAERREGLYEQKWIPFEELDDAASSVRTLAAGLEEAKSSLADLEAGSRDEDIAAGQARLDGLRASLQRIDVDLADSTLMAPFAGRIGARLVDEGEVIAAGTPVVQLLEVDRLEAWVGVPTEQLASFLSRAPRDLSLVVGSESADVPRTPAVTETRSLPGINTETRTATLILGVDSTQEALLAGEVIRLGGETRVESRGFWLPIRALSGDLRGLWSAYLLVPDGQAGSYVLERALLEILHTEGNRVYARGDLADGSLVASDGLFRVVPGERVRLAD